MEDAKKLLNQLSAKISENQAAILSAVEKARSKDDWDKFAILSSFISSVILVSIGGIFTFFFKMENSAREVRESAMSTLVQQENSAQAEHRIRLLEMDAVSNLLPDITGNDESKKQYAFEVLDIYARPETVFRLAKLYPSIGSVAALSQIEKSSESDNEKADLARRALKDLDFKTSEQMGLDVQVQQTKEVSIQELQVKVAVHAIETTRSFISVINLATGEAFPNFPGSGNYLVMGDVAILERDGFKPLTLTMTGVTMASGNGSTAKYVFGWQGDPYRPASGSDR